MSGTGCSFCAIAVGKAPAAIIEVWPDVLALRPHRPVVDGHILVIPRRHVEDAGVDPWTTGLVIMKAAGLARELYPQFNLITSAGPAATQTVFHLHVHIVPRIVNDGLTLPWTGRSS